MAVLEVPRCIDDLAPGWLGDALSELADGAYVATLKATTVGNGLLADTVRLLIEWDRPTAAPCSVVAKVPASDPVSRAGAGVLRAYETEIAFYTELAPSLWVQRPACHLARYEPASGGFVLLLEDLAPAEAGGRLTGCSLADAHAAVPELAALHAPRWGDPRLLGLPWLEHPHSVHSARTAATVRKVFPAFEDRLGERIDPEVMALCRRFMISMPRYLASRPGPWTVLHGDFGPDNLLFGGPRVSVIDWQAVRCGPAMADVAYFVGSAFDVEARRAHEVEIVGAYREALAAAGVSLEWDACWDGYRRYGFDGVVAGVLGAMLVTHSDYGDMLWATMVNRHGRQCLDLGSADLLGD